MSASIELQKPSDRHEVDAVPRAAQLGGRPPQCRPMGVQRSQRPLGHRPLVRVEMER